MASCADAGASGQGGGGARGWGLQPWRCGRGSDLAVPVGNVCIHGPPITLLFTLAVYCGALLIIIDQLPQLVIYFKMHLDSR
jgi:hypothetical protein